jgi:pyrroloquinoline quinone (PQQ) biosynthesis protein C
MKQTMQYNEKNINFSKNKDLENDLMNIIESQWIINNEFLNLAWKWKLSVEQLWLYVLNFYAITEWFTMNLADLLNQIKESSKYYDELTTKVHNSIQSLREWYNVTEEVEKKAKDLINNLNTINNRKDWFTSKESFYSIVDKIKKDEFAEFAKDKSESNYHHNMLRRMADKLWYTKEDLKNVIPEAIEVKDYIIESFTNRDLIKSLSIIFVIESMAAQMFTDLKATTDTLKDSDWEPQFTNYEKQRVDLHYKLETEEHIQEAHSMLDMINENKATELLKKYVEEFSVILWNYREAQSLQIAA